MNTFKCSKKKHGFFKQIGVLMTHTDDYTAFFNIVYQRFNR